MKINIENDKYSLNNEIIVQRTAVWLSIITFKLFMREMARKIGVHHT